MSGQPTSTPIWEALVTAALRTRLLRCGGWKCRGRRLSKAWGNPDTRRGCQRVRACGRAELDTRGRQA